MSEVSTAPPRAPQYRAMILRTDGVVVGSQPLSAASDQEALALAKALVNGHAVELWDGLRFVEHFDA